MNKFFALPFWQQLAKGLAGQFGDDCEVVIHDLTEGTEHTVIAIENGHVTGREVGGGSSRVVLDAINKHSDELEDRINYLTQTDDGRILKSSTIYIKNEEGKLVGIFAINYDITNFMMMDYTIKAFTETQNEKSPEKINANVNDLLQDLIDQSAKLINKPVSQMNREDKIKAIKFLNDAGAFLITKSGDKVAKYYNISKYTLYNYLDMKDG